MKHLKPYAGRLACTMLGLVAAVLFLTLGFFRTILILFCCGAGYLAGMYHDRVLAIPQWLAAWLDQ